MGLFNDIDPIFFYHKSVKPLLAMGFNEVVTPSGQLGEQRKSLPKLALLGRCSPLSFQSDGKFI